MIQTILSFFTAVFLCCSCGEAPVDQPVKVEPEPVPKLLETVTIEQPGGQTILDRFSPPAGFFRETVPANSFPLYLRNLPLKPAGTPVLLYDGNKKTNQNAHAAVIDIDTGKRDLQQCADAVMRLRAEYLFSQKMFADIHFNFVNGFHADYPTWRSGHRISVQGNNVSWVKSSRESTSYKSFREYLNMVFAYAGTPSLEKELRKITVGELQIGDVFIQGGSPGHAVIVVDVAVNEQTKQKLFMLAQSYMPAQDLHVLRNPVDKAISPWFQLDFGEVLETPEWRFTNKDLRRF